MKNQNIFSGLNQYFRFVMRHCLTVLRNIPSAIQYCQCLHTVYTYNAIKPFLGMNPNHLFPGMPGATSCVIVLNQDCHIKTAIITFYPKRSGVTVPYSTFVPDFKYHVHQSNAHEMNRSDFFNRVKELPRSCQSISVDVSFDERVSKFQNVIIISTAIRHFWLLQVTIYIIIINFFTILI